MKIRSLHLMPLAVLCGLTVTVCAAPPRNRSPFTMIGSADATKKTAPGATLIYSLTEAPTAPQTAAIGQSRQKPIQCLLRPIALRSVKGLTLSATARGVGENGARTWDICGQAVAKSGVYCDVWQVYDNLPVSDPRKNLPLQYVQTVIIAAPKPNEISPFATFVPRFVPPPLRLEDKSERERLSDALKPKLRKRLTRTQKAALKNGGEIALPVSALPALLQKQAIDYIHASTNGKPIGQAPETLAQSDKFSVVLLPPPSVTLGIDTYAEKPEQAQHF